MYSDAPGGEDVVHYLKVIEQGLRGGLAEGDGRNEGLKLELLRQFLPVSSITGRVEQLAQLRANHDAKLLHVACNTYKTRCFT